LKTDQLAAMLRGQKVAPPVWAAINVDIDAFCQAIVYHRVLPLAARQLLATESGPSEELVARMGELARLHTLGDMAMEIELRASLAALDNAGVRPIVFKGAHVAYQYYERPELRSRVDTDILVPDRADARLAAHEALIELGYETRPTVGRDLVMTQQTYKKRRGAHLLHAVDLHWRIANPQVFSQVLLHEELERTASDVPRLGPTARAPSGAHALLIACIHRVAHHDDSDTLIWLYDIDRIARHISEAEWSAFLTLVSERHVAAVCRASLLRTVTHFGTPLPDRVADAVQSWSAVPHERSARYLTQNGGAVSSAIRDLCATSSFGTRAQVALEHLMPPAAYMRAVYAPNSRRPLAWLYAERVLLAAARSWRRPTGSA